MQIHTPPRAGEVSLHKQEILCIPGGIWSTKCGTAHHPSSDHPLIVTTPANPTHFEKGQFCPNKQMVRKELYNISLIFFHRFEQIIYNLRVSNFYYDHLQLTQEASQMTLGGNYETQTLPFCFLNTSFQPPKIKSAGWRLKGAKSSNVPTTTFF